MEHHGTYGQAGEAIGFDLDAKQAWVFADDDGLPRPLPRN
jgi:hypothetical protein